MPLQFQCSQAMCSDVSGSELRRNKEGEALYLIERSI